ncbi:hypothetical protein TI05_05915 [Achromatium sp. WMS3]|nr:hypothetical protein TI05_05915 [Achromatium sp. WMS3]
MSAYIQKTLDSFIESILTTQQKLERSKGEIDRKSSQITTIIDDLYSKVQNYTNETKNVGGGELGAQVHTEVQRQLDILQQWKEQIAIYRKGVTFISKFEESCIVVVYGKVKAGKSTLGNFIRGKQIVSSKIATGYKKLTLPKIEVYDQGKLVTTDELHEIDEADEFGVKSTEATRVIQSFTLGGLSWIDTPGIGSITTENEKLAQEYVQNADLVLYLTNSDAAGAQQDVQELQYLQARNKPICIIATRCDQIEEDEDASGNIIKQTVPKPEKDIKDVEGWITQQIKTFNISDVLNTSPILSISVKLAKDAIDKADDDLFRASKLDKFYDKLTQIMVDDAIDYKKRNPQAKVNSLIDDILQGRDATEGTRQGFSGLHALQKTYEDFLRALAQKDKECQQIAAKSAQSLRTTGKRIIPEIVDKYNAAHTSGTNTGTNQSLELEINERLTQASKKILQDEITKLITDFQTEVDAIELSHLRGNTKIENKYETVTWQERYYSSTRRSPEGLWEGVCSVFGKKYYSTESGTKTRSKQIEVGTNALEIANALLEEFITQVVPNFENTTKLLGQNYFIPLKQSLEKMLEVAKQAETSLHQCKFN